MFSSLWKSLGEGFDKRWLLTSFGPALVFWGASLLVYGAGTGWAFITAWEKFPDWFQTMLLAGSLAGIVFTAYLLDLFSTPLLRLAEGYDWERVPLVGWWLRQGADERVREAEAPQKRFAQLQKKRVLAEAGQGESLNEAEMAELLGLEQRLYYRPPDPARAMPTALGNVLRAAEDAVRARYGLDPIVCWSRLYPLLPEAIRADLGAARGNMDAALRASLLGVVFTFVWGIWSLWQGAWLLALATLAGFGVAWLGYRAGVQAAVPYADLIRAAFDLYRFELYKNLCWPPPQSPGQERPAALGEPPTIGQQLSQYLWRGEGTDHIQFISK
jgi:hypothetical protein